MTRNVAILIFDDVEVLDFCGPFEVFSVTGRRGKQIPFKVYTVAEKKTITARNGLVVQPTYTFKTCPTPDILVVPGGGGIRKDGTPFGTRKEMNNQTLLKWMKRMSLTTEHILSVCTGALLMAKAGLMEDLTVTTHHLAFGELRKIAPASATIRENTRIVDNGHTVFSAGVSAGIDASFHLVGNLLGREVAEETASYIEYS